MTQPLSHYYGLIEISFFELLVLAFAAYELWTVRKYLQGRRAKKPDAEP